MRYRRKIIFLFIAAGLLGAFGKPIRACDRPELSKGQIVYVPAYSHIYSASNEMTILLAVTLSIRNTDINNPLKLNRVDYYGTKGNLLKEYLDSTIVLGPLESLKFVIPEKDESGGSGANFIIEWSSDKCTNQPIVETIMIGTVMQQGISFTSRGQVIVDSEH